ncbi:MAG: MarR family winged helix-turn-helix transcriptional regulator [Methanoculleus marisnigri]|nr:MarR family winged helix-turn-helix transcriptional regulator [Methanoculleus marisnigri]
MTDIVNGSGILLDDGKSLILTGNQIQTILHLFRKGPDYVYSIAKETKIRQPTLQNIVGRLEEHGLICLSGEEKGDTGISRKNYTLTGPGWCTAAMLLLKQGSSPFVSGNVAEALNRGIARRADAFKPADGRDDSLHGQLLDTLTEEPLRGGERWDTLFLEHWEEIIRIAEVYPNPPDFGTCMNWDRTGFIYKTPDLFVPKDDPRWVWYAALYYACSGAFDIYSQTRGGKINGAVFDTFFPVYLMTGGYMPLDPPAWIPYCCDVLRAFDDLAEYTAAVFGAVLEALEKTLATYRGAIASLEGVKTG